MRQPLIRSSVVFVWCIPYLAQAQSPVSQRPAEPPPATRLEAFKPAAGTVVTLGYDELGVIGKASFDVRAFSDGRGSTARGLLVEVTENEYRKERAFVDEDELPELLRGIDALLGVKKNPTSYKQFEVRYTTKGDLRLTAFNDEEGAISYTIEAGRVIKATTFVDGDDLRKLKELVLAARQKLGSR